MKSNEKEELFGSVVVEPTDLVREMDTDVLKNPEDPNTVISAFCENCGTHHELGYLAAEKILMTLNQPLEFEGKYFIFHSCNLCKGEDLLIELKHF